MTLQDPERVGESLRYCADVVRHAAGNFRYGLRLLPGPERRATDALYAWMRAADDIADEASLPREQRLAMIDEYRALTHSCFDGSCAATRGHWPAFAWLCGSYNLRRAWFDDLLDGMVQDLNHTQPRNADELDAYCYRVASTVGLASCAIWGCPERHDLRVRCQEFAERRGKALQCINIARDIGRDFDAGRVYVPSDWLEDAAISQTALRNWREPEPAAAVVRRLCEHARAHLAASAGLEDLLSVPCARVLWTMTRIYTGLLVRIESDPSRAVASRPVRLSRPAKILIALISLIGEPWREDGS